MSSSEYLSYTLLVPSRRSGVHTTPLCIHSGSTDAKATDSKQYTNAARNTEPSVHEPSTTKQAAKWDAGKKWSTWTVTMYSAHLVKCSRTSSTRGRAATIGACAFSTGAGRPRCLSPGRKTRRASCCVA
jgi:hypothetical protein